MGRVRAVRRNPAWRIGFAATEVSAAPEVLLDEERALVEGPTAASGPAGASAALGSADASAARGPAGASAARAPAGASAARLAEFATGRHCARLALESLSDELGRIPVLADHRGAPLWPAGVVGSITHCPGWTGAVVARARRGQDSGAMVGQGARTPPGPEPRMPPGPDTRMPSGRRGLAVLGSGLRSIGLDAEPAGPLPPGVLDVVASHDERKAMARLGGVRTDIPWDTVLFAAKEAAYKAWYPLAGSVIGHDAVRVDLSPTGTFTAVVRADDTTGREVSLRVRGRWTVGPKVVVVLGVVA